MFLVIMDVTLQNQKQELQHTLWPLKSSSLVLFPELVWFLLHKHKHKHKYIWICDHLKIFVIQVTESAKFDICDIRGGFDTGRLFLNNNLEHKRSDHIWTLSTMRSFLFGIINSFTDRQLRQSLTKKKVYQIPVQQESGLLHFAVAL